MGKINIRVEKMWDRNNVTMELDPSFSLVTIPMDNPICSSRVMGISKFENAISKLKRKDSDLEGGRITADIACFLDRSTESFQIECPVIVHFSLPRETDSHDYLFKVEEIVEEIVKRRNKGFSNDYTITFKGFLEGCFNILELRYLGPILTKRVSTTRRSD